MKKRSINEHLVTYYSEKKLPPQLRDELLSTISENTEDNWGNVKAINVTRNWYNSIANLFNSGRLAYASVVLLLGYIAWMVSGGPVTHLNIDDLQFAISNEIEMNHRKQFEVEFEEKTIAALSKKMDKLDFSLVVPARFAQSMKITGARYCSIRGKIAAQIQMIDSQGRYCTLYQTKLLEPLTKVNNSKLVLDGVTYSLWQEKGVFLGFAGPVNR